MKVCSETCVWGVWYTLYMQLRYGVRGCEVRLVSDESIRGCDVREGVYTCSVRD